MCPVDVFTLLHLIVYYAPKRIMRVITRRATMLAGDWSQGIVEAKSRRCRDEISPASILSESRNYPNCVYWRLYYFMTSAHLQVFLRTVESNLVYAESSNRIFGNRKLPLKTHLGRWKGRNCRDYRPSHLTFHECFRPFWFSRYFCISCIFHYILFNLSLIWIYF